MHNQSVLKANNTKSHPVSASAPREGQALLAGLLRCGRCGHKLQVRYRGSSKKAVRYTCTHRVREEGKPTCLQFSGTRVDQQVAEEVLAACRPLAIEASLMAFEEGHEKVSQKRRALEMSLKQARYEADRARRQYDAVEPENRLVSVELEKRWNEALQRVGELEDRIHVENLPTREIDQAQKQRLMQLGERLDQVWNDPNAPIELKKRIIRSLVNEIVVNLDDDKRQIDLNIHWAGGVHSRIQVRKNKAGHNHCATDKNVVEIVRVYAQAWTDSYIASLLNRLGLKTGAGNSWNETRVKNLRLYHRIPVHSKCQERTWLTMSEAALQLEVSVCVIRTMISNELLPAQQFAKGAPWLIETKNLALPAVRSYTTHHIAGKKAPHEDNSQTLIPYL